ncbi:MAG TPA: sugar phosphate isomerase/epimerase family protein [Terriglobia bacterium]|nr:sugar phosphate isomerase/epimerase family protein [Terriglobia bacterium]
MGWKLGIIADEITEDFNQALDFIAHYSLHYVEVRDLWQKNIMNLPRPQMDRAQKLLQEHRLTVTDIGSPIFKYNLPEMPVYNYERATFKAKFTDKDTERLLLRSFELAHFFGTRKVRIFSYWRVKEPQKAYPYVRDRLAKAAQLAGKHDILLILENEPSCNVATGEELGQLIREVNSPNLRGNWDPANAAMLGEVPYPNGYHHVRGLFAHMHIKDVWKDPRTGKLAWAPVGSGFVDWKGQFEALRRDHYTGDMSLETHYRRPDGNKVESTRESLMGLFRVIKEASWAPA